MKVAAALYFLPRSTPWGTSNMSIPKTEQCLRPLLLTLANKGATQINEATVHVADIFKLSSEERTLRLPSGSVTSIRNRVGWARTFLNKAGLIEQVRRGVWKINELGQTALQKFPNEITERDLYAYKPFQDWVNYCKRDRSEEANQPEPSEIAFPPLGGVPPEEQIEQLENQLRKDVELDLLKQLREIDPTRFETIVVDLIIKLGYGASGADIRAALKSGPGDQGVDGVIKEDHLGLDLIYIQAKRWKDGSKVGRPDIQSFVGAMDGNAKKGVFITTAEFSSEAKQYANGRQDKRVILIDGPQLVEFMVEVGLGISVRQTYRTYRIDQDYLDQVDE